MVKIGSKEVVFSASFVMDKFHNASATFIVPNEYTQEYDLQVKEKPAEIADIPAEMWHDFNIVNGRKVVSFDVLPQGQTNMVSIAVSQHTQQFDVQIVRQAITHNLSMLVHVIVVREAK